MPEMTAATHPVVGPLSSDYASDVLGTGYLRFSSPLGIDGLAKVTDGRLDLLAVIALSPGKGQFRSFIEHAKMHYKPICIWAVWNDELCSTLKRYGFETCEETQPWGEIVDGYRWPMKTVDSP